jgi:hypothetical protein
MKNSSIIIALLLSTCICTAQQMHVKQFNFQSFRLLKNLLASYKTIFQRLKKKRILNLGCCLSMRPAKIVSNKFQNEARMPGYFQMKKTLDTLTRSNLIFLCTTRRKAKVF